MTKYNLRIVVTFVPVKPIIINIMRRILSALSIALFMPLLVQATDDTWKSEFYGSWPFNESGYHVYANDTLYESEYRYSGLGYWLYPDSANLVFDDSTTMANIYTRGNGNKPKSLVMTSGNRRIASVGNQTKYLSPVNVSLVALFKGAYAGETTITVRIGERPMDLSIVGTPNVDMTFERSFNVTVPAMVTGALFKGRVSNKVIQYYEKGPFFVPEITDFVTNIFETSSVGGTAGDGEDLTGFYVARDYPTDNVADYIRYESINTDVLTVDSITGELTVNGCGSGWVYVNFIGNDIFPPRAHIASLWVEVKKKQPMLQYATYNYTYSLGDEFRQVELSKTDAEGLTVKYLSDNESVATVDSLGNVKPVGVGYASIMAYVEETDSTYFASSSYYLTVQKGTPNLSFGDVSIFDTEFGSSGFPVLCNPDSLAPILWTSAMTDVATVDSIGNITVLKPGRTVITAKFAGDDNWYEKEVSYTLNVGKGQAGFYFDSVAVSNLVVELPLSTPFVSPVLFNPNGLNIEWSSSDEAVAVVDADGVVTVKGVGSVTVTASFQGDDNYLAHGESYVIEVMEAVPDGYDRMGFMFLEGEANLIRTSKIVSRDGYIILVPTDTTYNWFINAKGALEHHRLFFYVDKFAERPDYITILGTYFNISGNVNSVTLRQMRLQGTDDTDYTVSVVTSKGKVLGSRVVSGKDYRSENGKSLVIKCDRSKELSDEMLLVEIVSDKTVEQDACIVSGAIIEYDGTLQTVDLTDGIRQIEVSADAEIYDILGRRLKEIPSESGLYIINGRKVLIK